MMAIQAPKRARTLPGLPLSLYEQLAHIPRGLEANFMDKPTGMFGKTLRSRCASRGHSHMRYPPSSQRALQ